MAHRDVDDSLSEANSSCARVDRHQRVVFGAAVRVIGEIVHDLDCKDDTFGREEVAGSCRRIARRVGDPRPALRHRRAPEEHVSRRSRRALPKRAPPD